jgi:hypothetical protein
LSILSRADALSLLHNGNNNRNAALSASPCAWCGRTKAPAARLKVKPEFKFSKCKDGFWTAFLYAVSSCRSRARAVVVRKERVHSPNLREVKETFYKFVIRMMMKYDGKTLLNAKVVIDGLGVREFKSSSAPICASILTRRASVRLT